jgi:thiopeptide-type bacteriocin biosynthesis protein
VYHFFHGAKISVFSKHFPFGNLPFLKYLSSYSFSFKKEFGFNEYNSKQFNTEYRKHKATIKNILERKIENSVFKLYYNPLQKKSKMMRSVIIKMRAKMAKNKTDDTIHSLLISFIHMMLNRLFRSKNRMHELVIYDFMNRYYKIEIARIKYNKV